MTLPSRLLLVVLLGSGRLAHSAERCTVPELQHQSKDAATIQRLEKAWSMAFLTGDEELERCLLVAEFTEIASDGTIKHLDDELALARANKGRHVPVPLLPEVSVVLHGHAAAASGRSESNGAGVKRRWWFVDYYVWEGAQWRVYFAQQTSIRSEETVPAAIQLGESVVPLNGPWKFHVGDDPRWAEPAFDDSGWENVDLTPPAGARDTDVGLTGFVPGWAARGHAGYIGYAWYRFAVTVSPLPGQTLAVNGPFVVDSAYQMYINGRLMGGLGDFDRTVPTAYGFHRPQLFLLQPDLATGGEMLFAVRVWLGPWASSDPVGGGIHVAPAIGERAAIMDRYRLQWLEVFEGYIVDALEGVLFVLLMVMVLTFAPFDAGNRAYGWMAAALLLLAIVRGNQAVLFWFQVETIPEFELLIATIAVPLSLAAWVLAWHAWFGLESIALPKLVGAVTVLHIVAQFFSRSWFYGVFPHAVGTLLHGTIACVRLILLSAFVAVVVQGARTRGRESLFAVVAAAAVGVGLFAQELSMIGVPGIWFPFGVGVSRTEYAYAVFDLALFVVLLHRLWSFRTQPAVPEVAR